jgi:hypothetical protein
MAPRRTPDAWYWSFDIQPEALGSILVPGARIVRLAAYRKSDRPRYAALVYQDGGPERRWLFDLEAAAIEGALGNAAARAVSITVDAAGPTPRFSLVTQSGPGPLSSVHVGLDAAAAGALLDDQHTFADLVTYLDQGERRYAVIREERSGPSWLLTGLTAHELDAALVERDAGLARVRGYLDGGVQRFVAVAERVESAWAWYHDLEAEAVARALETNAAYPFDLDVARDDRGLRFTVVMYRDRLR